VIRVNDNGIGIAKDNHKRIFEKLFRVPTGDVHNVKGFGLGLSYVKSTRDVIGGIVIRVNDNGIGIAKDNHKRIFEKLFRVPTGDVHNVKGFGLGLSYVKSIIALHDGNIMVESKLGLGSTFIINLKSSKILSS
jgi:signal transduction histidine kinase